MAKRTCAVCGRDKEIKNGRICEKGHFICANCAGVHKGVFFDHRIKKCPICGKTVT